MAQTLTATAKDLQHAMREIVWSIETRNDTLEDLVTFVDQRAESLFHQAGIRCLQEAPDSLPEIRLPLDVRNHVSYSIREALNNVLKHSKATEVLIRVTANPPELVFTIEDNGVGFNMNEVRGGGRGLANLADRMRLAGGRFSMESRPSAGTKVTLRLRIADWSLGSASPPHAG